MPLQLRPTAPGLAVRARNEDPSHAGWSGDQAIGPERHLHRAACHSARVCGDRRHCRGRVAAALMLVRTTSGGLINSERRKHPPQRGDQAAHAGGQDLSQRRELPPVGPSPLCRNPRGLARGSSLLEHGVPERTEERTADRRLTDHSLSHESAIAQLDVHNPLASLGYL